MNKTVVACTGIITAGVVCLFSAYWYVNYLSVTGVIKMDRFTQCLQTIMSESRQGGQIINAEQAKEICFHAKEASDERHHPAKK